MKKFLQGERGSLPFAMLGMIVVGGVVVTLVATTMTGQRAARFDREFTTVVQSADAGVQEGANRIIRGELDPNGDLPPGEYPSEGPVTGETTNGDTYTWRAEKENDVQWRVWSVGERPDGTTRRVEAMIRDEPRFFVAAFADQNLLFRGGNSADSYGAVWDTGNGIVGTNEIIELKGNSTVDAVHLYNWDAYPDFGRCIQQSENAGCNDVLAEPDAIHPSARIGPRMQAAQELDTGFIERQLEQCGTPLTSWTASQHGNVLGTPNQDTVLCFENITFNADTTIAEGANVEIYITGRISVTNSRRVNCVGCNGTVRPDARRLSLFSIGDRVTLGNHVHLAAGIYAPNATCQGNSSGGAGSAQADVYGSLICRVIDNQGGWNFHYDDRLLDIGTNEWAIESWREEPSGS